MPLLYTKIHRCEYHNHESTPNLWIGLGCQKGISAHLINLGIEHIFRTYQLNYGDIAGIATVDIKASEQGIIDFCDLHSLPLKTFSKEVLAQIRVLNPEDKITNLIGIPSVAEASAILAASTINSEVSLLVPKQIFRLSDQIGAITLAVAVVDN